MSTFKTRLMGLAAALALVVFVAGVPALLVAIDATPTAETFDWSTLSAPDDGTVALGVIGVVAWIAWAIFTLSVVLDIAARVRSRRAPELPGLAVPQLAAGQLVGLATLLFISLPAVTAVATVPRAEAAPLHVPERTLTSPAVPSPAVAAPEPENQVEAADAHATDAQATEAYTVKRGDSLWKIANERLGDGTRYVELVALNRAILGDRPDFLDPGTVLRVPLDVAGDVDADHSPVAPVYVVQPGDTLSEIAEDELGDATAYPEIVEASRSTIKPDGTQLSDPNLIRPGWRLTLPSTAEPAAPADQDGTPPPHRPEPHSDVPTPQPTPQPVPTEQAEPATPKAEQHPPHDTNPATEGRADENAAGENDADENDEALPSWVLPGLAGGGAALAGALLAVLRQHRRTQLRYRIPGRIIAPPPAELRHVEKSIHASGTVTAPRVEHFDQALRTLGSAATPAPLAVTAALGSGAVDIVLAQPTALPPPWRGDGIAWSISPSEITTDQTGNGRIDNVAPYPLMVSVGANDQGALVYVNLEALQTLALLGDPDRATALGRHIAAELSLNPWSTLVEIEALGIGDELADIDPNRLHSHDRNDTAFLDHLANDLEAENPEMEPDQYRVLIAAADTHDGGAVGRVAKIVTSYAGRAGAAVITIGPDSRSADVELHLTSGGRLTIDALGLDLLPAGLTADEARACATLIDITRDATNITAPATGSPRCSDSAGALTPELTEPRPQEGPAGPSSLLPLAVRDYEKRAAVVADDLDALAPLTSADTEAQVTEQDAALDEDIARWQASSLTGPKLTLLGPVTARTLGDPRKMAHRRPFYIELLAYLVLHPKGVTADDVANAFGIRDDRARKDLGILRGWLGRDHRTGEQHLPNARQTHATGVHATYAVHGIATDLDLFRRLRARGQSRGAAGIDDLRTALTLVSGEPFSDLRPSGWSWLLEGERLDHVISCAIVDTGHILTTHALSIGDLDLARFSSERTYQAAPYDETSRLDIIAVAKALSADEDADRLLTNDILNRSDDDLGPIAVPDRTADLLSQRGWIIHRQNRSVG